jgi:nitroimidazol reductase NimA-like FMN-containing flavoprotein (pyridoxamine 5'-phosphate oxidase superfamily)
VAEAEGTDAPAPDQSWRGKVGELSEEELNEFLARGILCRLAVLDDNGWPYVQPVWFAWDPNERVFWIVARKKSAWAGFMSRDARVSLTIDEDARPLRKVFVQGRAEVIEEPNVGGRWVEIAREMATRYLGPHGPDYIVPTLDKPRWLFKIVPTEMSTWQGVEWARRYKG